MHALLVLLAALSVLAACGDRSPQPTMTSSDQTPRVTIHVGEMGPVFAGRYPGLAKVQHQPAGVDFYRMDWDHGPQAQVTLDHAAHTVTIDHVIGLLTQQDLESEKSEGLNEFSIYTGLSTSDRIGHDDARLATYDLLRKIAAKGWRIITPPSRPRLKGRERLNYALSQSSSVGLDLEYVPTLQEWMDIPNLTPWLFHADGVFLEVSFQREPTLLDPAKPGAYLLTFKVQSQTEYARSFVDPNERARWKELVQGELKKAASARAKKEADLKARGIAIDETYADPELIPRS